MNSRQVSASPGDLITSPGTKLGYFFFIKQGSVDYWQETLQEPYYRARAGRFIGFTDVIYKLKGDDLINLLDETSFFSEYTLNCLGRFKFEVRATETAGAMDPEPEKLVLFAFDFRKKILDRWKAIYPHMLDKFFKYQVNQLRVIHFHQLNLLA